MANMGGGLDACEPTVSKVEDLDHPRKGEMRDSNFSLNCLREISGG